MYGRALGRRGGRYLLLTVRPREGGTILLHTCSLTFRVPTMEHLAVEKARGGG